MSTELRAPVRVGLHVGGHWGQAASGETFESRSPATGEVLAIVRERQAHGPLVVVPRDRGLIHRPDRERAPGV